ncbi:MAG TPA: phosphatidylserine decarboxylase family protein [candidate division Zixibacteria bacterium]|nr:phosphatidylserine decarboxylase family protein [candidate division Zixibacteria bacterium]
MKIVREGYRFVVAAAAAALVAAWAGWPFAAGTAAVAALFFAWFFRDPERVTPPGDDLIVAPADGRVVSVVEVREMPFLEEAGRRVSIFMSPLDVHVNRMPVAGTVEEVRYRPGKFLAAYRDSAVEENEQNAMTVVSRSGRKVGVVQVAGLVARRIVCRVRPGDTLERGERFGLIMFGSRTDLYLPRGSAVEVAEGARVKGGETIIGRFV